VRLILESKIPLEKINYDWIGHIPSDWELKKFKFIFKEKKSTKNLLLCSGSISFGEVIYKNDDKITELTKSSYQEVLNGEFLINPLNLNFDLKSLRIGLSKINVVVSQGYIVLKINKGFCPNYYKYLLRKFDVEYMKSLGQGVRQTISFNDIKNEYLVVPNFDEQKLISQYLDKKTEKIDLLIEKIEKKIEFLKEKKNSLINHYVTKGVNPNIEMKDSGVELIGNIPKHWKMCKIKYLTTIITKGTTPSNIGESFSDNQEVRFIKGEDLIDQKVLNKGKTFISHDVNEKLKRSQLQKDDLLVVIAGTLGKSAIVVNEILPANTNQAISLIRFKNKIHSLFTHFYFQSSSFQKQVIENAVIAAQPNLSMEDLGNFHLPLPSNEDVEAINNLLEEKSTLITNLIKKTNQKIILLKEYRQSLISSVVTGKIQITEDML